MIHMAACRYIADWLCGDIGGGMLRVNSFIAGVPRFAGDAEPDPFVFVTDIYRAGDTNSGRAAKAEDLPSRYPAIIVTPSGPVPMEGEIGVDTRDALLTVAISIEQRMSDYARAAQWASYYAKAISRAMVPFLAETEEGRTARGEGNATGIYVIACVGDPKQRNTGREYSMVLGGWELLAQDNVTEQALFYNLQVRDLTP